MVEPAQTPSTPHAAVGVLSPTQERAPAIGQPEGGTRRGRDRLGVLDGLRLLAALMVVAFHYTYRAPGEWGAPTVDVFPHLYHVTQYGRLGVELFFLISGFVICMSAWGRGLGAYFTSRVTRLYPAYWFAVLATTVALAFFGTGHAWEGNITSRDLIVNLTMLPSWLGVRMVDTVYWTLAIELHFYLLLAILVWRGLTYRRVVVFCVLWIAAAALVPTGSSAVLDALIDQAHAPFFVAGMAMYLMYQFRPTILLWGIVGVSYALSVHRVIPTLGEIGDLSGRPVSIAAGLGTLTGIFAVMLAISLGWLNWVRGAWLTTAGALTYPLYLMHQYIGWIVIDRLHARMPAWVLLTGLVAALLVVSWLVHRLVERPLARRFKRALASAIAETSVDQQPRRAESVG